MPFQGAKCLLDGAGDGTDPTPAWKTGQPSDTEADRDASAVNYMGPIPRVMNRPRKLMVKVLPEITANITNCHQGLGGRFAVIAALPT